MAKIANVIKTAKICLRNMVSDIVVSDNSYVCAKAPGMTLWLRKSVGKTINFVTLDLCTNSKKLYLLCSWPSNGNYHDDNPQLISGAICISGSH